MTASRAEPFTFTIMSNIQKKLMFKITYGSAKKNWDSTKPNWIDLC